MNTHGSAKSTPDPSSSSSNKIEHQRCKPFAVLKEERKLTSKDKDAPKHLAANANIVQSVTLYEPGENAPKRKDGGAPIFKVPVLSESEMELEIASQKKKKRKICADTSSAPLKQGETIATMTGEQKATAQIPNTTSPALQITDSFILYIKNSIVNEVSRVVTFENLPRISLNILRQYYERKLFKTDAGCSSDEKYIDALSPAWQHLHVPPSPDPPYWYES